jgi:hypothetical protein
MPSLTAEFIARKVPADLIVHGLRGFNGYSRDFRLESERIEAAGDPMK